MWGYHSARSEGRKMWDIFFFFRNSVWKLTEPQSKSVWPKTWAVKKIEARANKFPRLFKDILVHEKGAGGDVNLKEAMDCNIPTLTILNYLPFLGTVHPDQSPQVYVEFACKFKALSRHDRARGYLSGSQRTNRELVPLFARFCLGYGAVIPGIASILKG